MIRVVEVPADFEFPVNILWREPVELPTGLPDDFDVGHAAYDLLSDGVDGSHFYVGLGDGKACRVRISPFTSQRVCPHCGFHF